MGQLTKMVLEGSDQDLIDSCRRGELEAFRALFEAHRDRIYAVALRYSGDESVAMDIAQETFMKLFASLRDFRGDASFQTWVYRLVVNCCFDHKRRNRRLVHLSDGFLATLRASADCLGDLLRSEKNASVRTAIDRLSPALRMAVVLRYTEGLSYQEMANVLGCSQGTVASRLNRAHRTLERRLSHLGNHEGAGNV